MANTSNPAGVEVRDNSIRLAWTAGGVRHRETLRIPPTPKNIAYAAGLLEEIKRRSALGVLDICDYFPDSPRCRRDAPPPAPTIEGLVETWLEVKRPTLAETTQGEDRNALARYLVADLGPLNVDALTFAILSKHLAGLAISGKTRNNVLGVIAGLVRYGIKAKLIRDHDTLEAIEMVKVQKPGPDPLTRDEVAAILGRLARDPSIERYFRFAFYTGLRPSELIALSWADVDLRRGMVRVQRAKVRTIDKDTKTHAARDVELVAPALEALVEQKAETYLAGGPVWTNPRTRRAWADTADLVARYWRPTLKALGIRDRDARQTRHTYATLCLAAGLNPAYVSRQMGHASTKMFFEVYSTWIEGADQGVQRRAFEAFLSLECPQKNETPAKG